MGHRLSRKAEEDLLQIYLAGVGEFGVNQAERYHAGLEQAFVFLSPTSSRWKVLVGPEGSDPRA
jgi:plasmid stabilization system protein ParE